MDISTVDISPKKTEIFILEYSIAKDATFCLCCYIFKPDIEEQLDNDSFVSEGFSN